jgi:hypothetical protein
MTQTTATPAEPIAARSRRRTAGTWSANLLLSLAVILLLLGVTAITVFWRFRQQHLQALADVQAEVARIQAAGQPITVEDFVAFHQVPQGTTDTTALWLAAIRLAVQPKGPAAGNLPYVGTGRIEQLNAQAPTLLPAAEAYLAAYEDAVVATRQAAAAKGECRYPIDFRQGASAKHGDVQNLRQLSRLLSLRARVATNRGREQEAIESIELLLALGHSLDNEPAMTSQLVRNVVFDMSLAELELLIGNQILAEEQLARLESKLQAIETQGPTRLAILGERRVGYREFHHMANMPTSGAGKLERPADCLAYLHMMDDLLAAADMPAADRMQEVLKTGSQLNAKAHSLDPWQRSNVALSLQVMPAFTQLFHATARFEAERDSALAGVAFRRFQLKHGRAPSSLAEMIPEFLPAVPADPFRRGAPLTLVTTGNQFAIYSVGINGVDDGKLLIDPDTQDDTGMAGNMVIAPEPISGLAPAAQQTSPD